MKTDWSRRTVLGGLTGGLALTALPPGAPVRAQSALPSSPQIVRHDPAFDALIDADARFERLLDGLGQAEGPAWFGGANGFLLVSDVPGNTIHRWSAGAGASQFLQPSGYAGPPSLMSRSPGSNGLIAARGGLVIADQGNRGLARIDLRSLRKTMLCTRFEGQRFNSPNDLVLARDGSIYFTDPTYGVNAPYRELGYTALFRLMPDNSVIRVDASIVMPNGIGISPDHRTLYTTEEGQGWVAFDLDPDGLTSNRRYFVSTSETGITGGDGFKIDAAGNMWTSSNEGITVFDPQGRKLGSLSTGDTRHANCEIGADGHLYIAHSGSLSRVPIRARRLVF